MHLHRKLNLPTYGRLEEGKLFAQGQRIDAFEISPPWTAGLLICADLWNPALVHLALQQQATVLLAPVNSAMGAVSDEFSNPAGWDLALRFYAMMYGVPVLMANRAGTEGGARFWGGSCIVGPRGEILAQAAGDSPCLLTADLHYDAVRSARFQLPTLRDANLPLVQREINRLAGLAGGSGDFTRTD
jgi:N-carbamoylputrescine amidase